QEISFLESSLSGQVQRLVPLPNASSTFCGHYKPIGVLVFGVAFVVLALLLGLNGSGMGVFISLALGAILLVVYFLSKTMLISIETVGGAEFGLRFKTSVVEGVAVDAQKVLQAVKLINRY